MATQIESKNKNTKMTQRAPKKPRNGQAPAKAITEICEKNRKAIEFLDSMDNATPEEIQEQKET